MLAAGRVQVTGDQTQDLWHAGETPRSNHNGPRHRNQLLGEQERHLSLRVLLFSLD